MAVVLYWQLFPRGSCPFVAVVPSWQLYTWQLSLVAVVARGSCPLVAVVVTWQLSGVAVVYKPLFTPNFSFQIQPIRLDKIKQRQYFHRQMISRKTK